MNVCLAPKSQLPLLHSAASSVLYFITLSSTPIIAPYGNFKDVLYLNKLFFIEITVTDVLCSICFAMCKALQREIKLTPQVAYF